MSHPIRQEVLNVWRAHSVFDAPEWIVMFGFGRTFPIWFSGETAADAIEKAEAFRSDVIEKHEANFIARKEAIEKAREAKKARKK